MVDFPFWQFLFIRFPFFSYDCTYYFISYFILLFLFLVFHFYFYLVFVVLTKYSVQILMLCHSLYSFCFLCSMVRDRIPKEEQYEVEWPCTIFGILTLLVNKGVFFTFFSNIFFYIGDNASFSWRQRKHISQFMLLDWLVSLLLCVCCIVFELHFIHI